MAIKFDSRIIMGICIILAFFGGIALAAPKTGGGRGFDDYGYNDDGTVFMNCKANYVNWKNGAPATICSETDMEVHIKWKFDKDGNLDWFLNLLYSPVSESHVMKKFVTISQEECSAVGGAFMTPGLVVKQTGEIVPVCQIMQATSGEGATLIATPVGFGVYQGN